MDDPPIKQEEVEEPRMDTGEPGHRCVPRVVFVPHVVSRCVPSAIAPCSRTAGVPASFFSHTATAHAHRTSSSVAADATVLVSLTLPDILFVIVQWFLPPPERRDKWFRRGDE